MTEQQAQDFAERFAKKLADSLRQEQQAHDKWLKFLDELTERLM